MRDQEIVGLWEAYASMYTQTEQTVEEEVVDEDLQQKVGQALDAAAKNPVIKAIGGALKPVGPGRKTPIKDGNWRPVVAKEEAEEVDEAMSSYDRNRKRAAQRAADRNAARDRGQTGNVPGVGYVSPRRERETYTDESGQERHKSGARMPKKEDQKESFDLFDYLLEYLVAEGYADTNKAALAIMANMSEEWKQSIVEEVFDEALTGERYKKAVKKPGGTAYSRMVSADPSKRATRGGRGGESDFGAGDRGSGNKAARRAGTYKED